MLLFRSSSPWVIALLDIAVFLVVWSAAIALVAGRGEVNDIILVASLVLAATVVFWWAFHSVPAFVEGRVSVLSTAKEGVLWAASLSIMFSLCALVFGST